MRMKPIGPTVPPIVFKGQKDCQPIKPAASQALYCVTVVDADGNKKEVHMNDEQLKQYNKEQEQIKQQRWEEEQARKQQEWLALINRPGTYTKGVTENNKNKGFQ